MIARLPSFSAKAGPLWPKHLSRQPGHPICWPACRRAGCLQRAYPSHATEQDDATTELTVAGGPRRRIQLAPSSESGANLTSPPRQGRSNRIHPRHDAFSRPQTGLDRDSVTRLDLMQAASRHVSEHIPLLAIDPHRRARPLPVRQQRGRRYHRSAPACVLDCVFRSNVITDSGGR